MSLVVWAVPSAAERGTALAGVPGPGRSGPRRTPPSAGHELHATHVRHSGGWLQAKLQVGSTDDPLEHEADRIASRVVAGGAATADVTGSACACDDGGGCACPDEARGSLQRAAVPAPRTTLPASPPPVCSARPGQPLDPPTRRVFEPRLGADLGAVRLHTGPEAAASAAAVSARAFTVGSDIVFGAGEYAPGSSSGAYLLAHELVHVIQQRREAGRPPILRRQPFALNLCEPGQTSDISRATSTAQRWLVTADRQLSQFLLIPFGVAARRLRPSLERHFHTSDFNTARYVQNRIRMIAQSLNTAPGAAGGLIAECRGTNDAICKLGTTAAYSPEPGIPLLVICPRFFQNDESVQAATLVHEVAHFLLPARSGVPADPNVPPPGPIVSITDRAYREERLYANLSSEEALFNVDSYAAFVHEVNTQPLSDAAPRDAYPGCPPDWQGLIATALARAQRWNQDALGTVIDPNAATLASWEPLARLHLGGQTPADLAAAQEVYELMARELGQKVRVACELQVGGRCAPNQQYWYTVLSNLHLCPAWQSLQSDDDRAESLLAGFYGQRGGIPAPTRQSLALLAREINKLFYPLPTKRQVAAEVAAAAKQTPGPAPPPDPHLF